MKKSLVKLLAAGAAAATLLGLAGNAAAQTYPDRPIKLIVPFAAGGGTDVLSRIWADVVGQKFGQRVLVENVAGGAGAPGTKVGIAAAPDGYTLLAGVASTMAINPHIMANVGYTADDVQPVAMLTYSAWMMVVSATLPVNTVEELIAYDKANPGMLNFASWTSTGEMGRKAFALRTGVDILPVPYDGSVAAMTDLVAGRAHVALLDTTAALPFIRSGEVRPIAMTSSTRTDLFPDVRSISESGVDNYEVTSWVALFAPKGTPMEIVEKLNAATNETFRSDAVVQKFKDLGTENRYFSVAETAAFVAEQSAQWRVMAEETGSLVK